MDALLSAPIGALLIFALRVIDVSMAMMRMILGVRGHRVLAALIGFIEVFIWLIAVSSALKHLDSVFHIVGYAAGFATGNYVGVWLEGRFALGVSAVHAVFRKGLETDAGPVAASVLREQGYAVTEMPGRGRESDVDILNIVVQRKKVPDVLNTLHAQDPAAFVTVEEVRTTQGGYLRPRGYIRPGGRKMPFLTRF
jgi:uncharacterized protein YebE (UPF0316 family)